MLCARRGRRRCDGRFFPAPARRGDAAVKTAKIKSGSFIQAHVPVSALDGKGGAANQALVLTPYYAWNNRGAGSMTVWFPRKQSMAVFDPLALPKESVFAKLTATHTSELDTVNAIGDGLEPRWSSGNKVPRWTSRGQEGKPQTITGTFHGPKIKLCLDGSLPTSVKFPKEWKVEVLQDSQWNPFKLYTTDRYDTRANQFNVITPPLTCDAIRIHMTPREKTAMLILEMKVVFEKWRSFRGQKNLREATFLA